MLEKTHHQDAVVAADDVFRAVAVVHVEIDNRHAFEAVPLQCVFGRHRNVVEIAEAHGLVAAGMVAGGTHRAEGVFDLARHHRIGGGQGGTGRTQGRCPGVHVHRGVGVDLRVGRAARQDFVGELVAQAAQRGNQHAAMRQLQVADRRQRRLTSVQRIADAGDQEAVLNRIKPLRTFRVPGTHLVFPAVFMGEVRGAVHKRNFAVRLMA